MMVTEIKKKQREAEKKDKDLRGTQEGTRDNPIGEGAPPAFGKAIVRDGETTFFTNKGFSQALGTERVQEAKKERLLRQQGVTTGGAGVGSLGLGQIDQFAGLTAEETQMKLEEQRAQTLEQLQGAQGTTGQAPGAPQFLESPGIGFRPGIQEGAEALGLAQVAQAAEFQALSQGLAAKGFISNKQLKELQELNPEQQEGFLKHLLEVRARESRKNSLERFRNDLGVITESLGVGSVARYIPGIQTPSEKINTIRSSLTKADNKANTLLEYGKLDPETAIQDFNDEIDILDRQAAELQYQFLQSADIQNDPNEIDVIRLDLSIARAKMINARNKLVAQSLTGRAELSPQEMQTVIQQFEDLAKDI